MTEFRESSPESSASRQRSGHPENTVTSAGTFCYGKMWFANPSVDALQKDRIPNRYKQDGHRHRLTINGQPTEKILSLLRNRCSREMNARADGTNK